MRATLSIVKGLVYEYLRVNTQGSYGTYLSNERYPSNYIDNEIYSADTEIVSFLSHNGQDYLLAELYLTDSISDGDDIPDSWIIVSLVESSSGIKLQEVDEDTYEILDNPVFNTNDFSHYYTIVDGKFKSYTGTLTTITYIDLSRATSLNSPSGFEPAIAFLASSRALMNREDRPNHARYLLEQHNNFMAKYAMRKTNSQDMVED